MSAYREPGETDRIGSVIEMLEKQNGELDRIHSLVRKPQLDREGSFWVAVWPRILWPLVSLAAILSFAGYSCNRDTEQARIEIARAANAARPQVDAGAP